MGATERLFGELARKDGFGVVAGASLPWLSNSGHRNTLLVQTCSSEVVDRLHSIYLALDGDEIALECKRRGSDPRPDFLFPSRNLLVEVDEIQHFTSVRRDVLAMYPSDIELAYSRDEYSQVIVNWHKKADKYRRKKTTKDFDFEGGRQHQRAYFDAVRDLAANAFGLRVLRIPAPECDAVLAYDRFLACIGG